MTDGCGGQHDDRRGQRRRRGQRKRSRRGGAGQAADVARRLAMIVGLVLVVALAGLTGWLGFRAYQSYQADDSATSSCRSAGKARSISRRSTGSMPKGTCSACWTRRRAFYDDFQNRAAPFIEVVKQAQSKSVGTITEAGLESESDRRAHRCWSP